MEKQIGIFGIRGFIGTHLREILVSENRAFSTFEGNALNKKQVEDFFDQTKVREVIFLIGSFDPPIRNLVDKNLLTLQTLLEVGRHKGLQKIIYASSGAVYGNTGPIGAFETDPVVPISLYGLIKKYCEDCIHFYERVYGIQGVVLRFPHVYGDGNNKGVVFEFLTNMSHKRNIVINGDGKQGRNFLHVSEAALSLYKALNVKKNEVINVAYDRKTTINDLVKMIQNYHDVSYSYVHSNEYLNDTMYLNASKCSKILHFTPHIDIEAYIRQKLV